MNGNSWLKEETNNNLHGTENNNYFSKPRNETVTFNDGDRITVSKDDKTISIDSDAYQSIYDRYFENDSYTVQDRRSDSPAGWWSNDG